MKLHPGTGIAVAALTAAALVGGGATYAATQSDSSLTGSSPSEDTMMSGHSPDMAMGMGMGANMASFTDDSPFDAQFLTR